MELDIELNAGTKAYALVLLARRNLPKAGLLVRKVVTGEDVYERVGMWEIISPTEKSLPIPHRSDFRDVTLV